MASSGITPIWRGKEKRPMPGPWPKLAVVAVAVAIIGTALSGPARAASQSLLPSWSLGETLAHGLRAAAPRNDLRLGALTAVNRTLASGLRGLRELVPHWADRFTADIRLNRNWRTRYDVATEQPIYAGRATQWTLLGRFTHDPAGRTSGDFGLRYRRDVAGGPLTFGLRGGLADHWAKDRRRFSLGAELRGAPFEIGAVVFDDVADRTTLERDLATRPVDGYDLTVGARLPGLSWAWLKANRYWQVDVDSRSATTRDRYTLRLRPFAPLEIEAGTVGINDDRSWFAQLRLRLRFGVPGSG